jgi:hypothetical protein
LQLQLQLQLLVARRHPDPKRGRMGDGPHIPSLPLFVFLDPPKKNVISTEAAHGFIVSSAVERSLYFAFAVVCSSIFALSVLLPNPKNHVILSKVAHGTS